MEINEDFVPATKKCVEIEELDDGCILYDTEKDEAHSLKITAASVWTCCDGKHSIKQITAILLIVFIPHNQYSGLRTGLPRAFLQIWPFYKQYRFHIHSVPCAQVLY